MPDGDHLTITIGGQDLTLRVKADEREDVLEAAKMVKEQMKDLAEHGVVTVQQQAAMTAFYLAFDWVRLMHDPLFEKKVRTQLEHRIDALLEQVDQSLETT
jgi:cell division protein ZapA (FtsZ GTPase activity inhibitor)